MNADTTYNGWKNYETWRINLEICDDLTSNLANDIRDGDQEPFNDVSEMAKSLSEEVDNVLSHYGEHDNDGSYDLVLSYARAFVSDVDFYEIAEAAIADFPGFIAQDDEA